MFPNLFNIERIFEKIVRFLGGIFISTRKKADTWTRWQSNFVDLYVLFHSSSTFRAPQVAGEQRHSPALRDYPTLSSLSIRAQSVDKSFVDSLSRKYQ